MSLVLDATGAPTSSIAAAVAPQQLLKKRDLKPCAGRVLVLRQSVKQTFDVTSGDELDNPLFKPVITTEVEEIFDDIATVARVGEVSRDGIEPEFKEGDVVVIEPALFRSKKLGPNITVWLGPFSGILGIFEEKE